MAVPEDASEAPIHLSILHQWFAAVPGLSQENPWGNDTTSRAPCCRTRYWAGSTEAGGHLGHVVLARLAQVVVQAPVLDAALLLRAELVPAARPVVRALDVRQQAHEDARLAWAHIRAVRSPLRLCQRCFSDLKATNAMRQGQLFITIGSAGSLHACCIVKSFNVASVHHPLGILIHLPAQAVFS